jgi:hypothetical protein
MQTTSGGTVTPVAHDDAYQETEGVTLTVAALGTRPERGKGLPVNIGVGVG